MTNSHSNTLLDPKSSADSAARADRELNAAIVSADISASYEEFLEIVDQFYADDVELRSDSSPEPLIGRDRLKSRLLGFLVPLHVMAEIGGLSVSISERPIAGDSLDEQHSQWSLELVGITGRAVRVGWSVRRRWKQSRVVAPPTMNLTTPDADNALNLIVHRAAPMPITYAMTNSFGFGGTNASLIFSSRP